MTPEQQRAAEYFADLLQQGGDFLYKLADAIDAGMAVEDEIEEGEE